MPRRVQKGNNLPLTLLIHDIHLFAIEVISVEVVLRFADGSSDTITISDLQPFGYNHPHHTLCHAYLFPLSLVNYPQNTLISVSPTLSYSILKRKKRVVKKCTTDNLPGNSQAPLSFFYAQQPLPQSVTTAYIDMHCHSLHTRDHVEFGAPLEAIGATIAASGQTAAMVIDHSYDLSCNMENYLQREDTSPSNWRAQQATVTHYDQNLFRGEELSTRYSYAPKDGVVHLGIIGNSSFIRGSGDGARFGYSPQNEPTLSEAITQVHKDGGVCYAAHPGETPPLLHQLLLRRGKWKKAYFNQDIDGFQGINSGFNQSWYTAKKLWIELLLSGKQIALLGGNDAHGDFNRYRALSIPFVSLKEDFSRYLGATTTGFYHWNNQGGTAELIKAIKEKRTFVTTGPFVDIQDEGYSVVGKDVLSSLPLTIAAISTAEFGCFTAITLYIGGKDAETKQRLSFLEGEYSLQIPLKEELFLNARYLRVEATTTIGSAKKEGHVVTSPLYFI